MGSLMAGWNCPALDQETARLERNKSLTKDEIDSFWKVRRRSCDDGMDARDREDPQAPSSPTAHSPRPSPSPRGAGDRGKSLLWHSTQVLEKIKTFPPGSTADEPDSPLSADKDAVAKLTGDWWTRSNWAFLNEPPHDELDESSHRYAAQFHVAEIATAAAAATQQPAH